jgi:serine/threonine-protein kinase RsbW
MSSRCDYSQLSIPNDHSYETVAGTYAAEVARKMGFPAADIRVIQAGVAQAMADLIDYSYEAGEHDTMHIGCERVPRGLKITISDKGMPLGAREIHEAVCHTVLPADARDAGGPSCLERFFDEVELRNLGPQGKETVLIRHLKGRHVTDYTEACEIVPFEPPSQAGATSGSPGSCTVRMFRPSDAAEIAKTVYKAYGYTYLYEHVYYPERLIELNAAGTLQSAVAVTDDGELAGHVALSLEHEGARIGETGQGVVKPEHRSRGCFTKLTELILDRARDMQLIGVLGQAVTNHTYSQHTAIRFGYRDCGLALSYLPPNIEFRGLSETTPDRMSLLIHFKYLIKDPRPVVYVPEQHETVIRKIYSTLGAQPVIAEANSSSGRARESVVHVSVQSLLNAARIDVAQFGPDVTKIVKTRLRELQQKRVDTIRLRLDLSDPQTPRHVQAFEDLGFIFCALLPGDAANGDALWLQALNNVPVNFEDIKVESELAHEILSYIETQYNKVYA